MDIGKLLITVGGLFIVIGALFTYRPTIFNWFGKLPFDINIQTEHTQVFIPITSMLVISLIFNLLMRLFR
ncbi:MAG: hypothetical protein RL755_1174 [Pseudomonadota bacterium]|jgi:hypothetical protein